MQTQTGRCKKPNLNETMKDYVRITYTEGISAGHNICWKYSNLREQLWHWLVAVSTSRTLFGTHSFGTIEKNANFSIAPTIILTFLLFDNKSYIWSPQNKNELTFGSNPMSFMFCYLVDIDLLIEKNVSAILYKIKMSHSLIVKKKEIYRKIVLNDQYFNYVKTVMIYFCKSTNSWYTFN